MPLGSIQRRALRHRLTFAIAITALLFSSGCATLANESAANSRDYYVVLGARGDPLVAATALTTLLPSPEIRVAVLVDIARRFLERNQSDNVTLILEDAIGELTESNTLESAFVYPSSRQISVYDSRDGSLIRAQLYLDIVEIYRSIEEETEHDLLLRLALNEILRAQEGTAQQEALSRYLRIANAFSVIDQLLLSQAIESALVYRYPVLHSDMLQILINLYTQETQENVQATQTIEQYLQLLIQEYEQQDSWIALALYTALQNDGLVSAAQLARVRSRIQANTPPFPSDAGEVETIARNRQPQQPTTVKIESLSDAAKIDIVARGLARGTGQDLIDLYLAIQDEDIRCDLAFANLDGLTILIQEFGMSAELLLCILAARPQTQQDAREEYAVDAAIRTGIFDAQLLQQGMFGLGASQNPAIYIRVAEEFLRINNIDQAFLYIEIFDRRFGQMITKYNVARQFATLYESTHTVEQIIERIRTGRNTLLQVMLLLEFDRRYDFATIQSYRSSIASIY